jgi:hypothetical protein
MEFSDSTSMANRGGRAHDDSSPPQSHARHSPPSPTTASCQNSDIYSRSFITPVASPLPFACLLFFATFSLFLEAQQPEINDQTNRKSGHAIDKNIGKENTHSPVE